MEQKKLEISEIMELRNRLINAFNNSTNSQITAEHIKLYVDNQYIKSIKEDICFRLGRMTDIEIISFYTFKKLFRNPLLPAYFDSTVRKTLDDYINKILKGNSVNSPSTPPLSGSILIDRAFINSKTENIERLNEQSRTKLKIDFYTTKIDRQVQWVGVAMGLDYPRKLLKIIEREILLGFGRRSKVCAVVVGPHGSGKSTFFRRLAFNCTAHKHFHTLWINNLSFFHANTLYSISDNGSNYLLILDDWTLTQSDLSLTESFFDSVLNSNNIRLIIGDVSVSKGYSDYIYGKNIFELEPTENRFIISHVLDNVKGWKRAAESVLRNEDLSKAPLFLILFVIIKYNEEKETKLNVDIDDFSSQFEAIIKKDQSKIYSAYPGLAKAFYYWASICRLNKRRNQRHPAIADQLSSQITISWQAFLQWGDFYESNNKATRDLLSFSEINPICKIFSYYLTFDEIVYPFFSDHKYFISFNHDSFIEALSLSPADHLYFNDDSIIALIELFIEIKQYGLAFDLFDSEVHNYAADKSSNSPNKAYNYSEIYSGFKKEFLAQPRIKSISSKLSEIQYGLGLEESFNHDIKKMTRNEHEDLEYNISALACFHYDRETFVELKRITSFLLDNGCKLELVIELNNACSSKSDLEIFCNKFLNFNIKT